MTPPLTFNHAHTPIFRVVRAGWQDPLDTTHAMSRGGRWNPKNTFGVLYTACSERVARAIAHDLFRFAAVEVEDLMPATRPALAEIQWEGQAVDVASPEGIVAAGFSPSYPVGVGHDPTQPVGVRWHEANLEAVACRSASLSRLGFDRWEGAHDAWSELAIFVDNARAKPHFLQLRTNLDWLTT